LTYAQNADPHDFSGVSFLLQFCLKYVFDLKEINPWVTLHYHDFGRKGKTGTNAWATLFTKLSTPLFGIEKGFGSKELRALAKIYSKERG
jgi:hypothetical protein